MKTDESGQTVIESLLVLPSALILVAALMAVCYFIFAKQAVQHHLHEGILCANYHKEVGRSIQNCSDQMLDDIKKWLPIGTIKDSEIRFLKNQIAGQLVFEIHNSFAINELQVLDLPILAPEASL